LEYRSAVSGYSTAGSFFMHYRCIVKSSLQELSSFKVVNFIISIQICDGHIHKISQSSADLSSVKINIIFLEGQKCNGQRNKDPSCLKTETDD
jgi:hypothetical protein